MEKQETVDEFIERVKKGMINARPGELVAIHFRGRGTVVSKSEDVFPALNKAIWEDKQLKELSSIKAGIPNSETPLHIKINNLIKIRIEQI
jgi:hypothetical protein